MSIEVLSTLYGPPATDLLGERIAELKGDDPLRAVTVVVPTNIAGIGARRALGTRKGSLIAVDFLKILDVAERLGRGCLADGGGRPMSGPVLTAAVRQVLGAEPGIFAAVARHPATEQALARSYRELRDLSEAALEALAAQSRRAREVVRIHRRAREVLRDRWIDEFDIIDAAVEALETDAGARSAADLGPVILYLPQRIANSQGRLLSRLAEVAGMSVIAGLSGDERADGLSAESLRRMGAPSPPPIAPAAASRARLVSVSDADEEVRAALRRVVDAARSGVPLARMAVLYGSRNPYASLLAEHLRAAGIEFNGPSSQTAAGSLVGRCLLTLLDIRSRDFRRSDVFALLAAAPPGGTGGVGIVAGWERIARRAGVVRGVEQWSERLARFASEQRQAAEAQRADPEGLQWRAERLEREADDADNLAAFVEGLAADLALEDSNDSWQGCCDWARKLIETYISDERSRQDWPKVEREAADAVGDVLDHLSALDEIGSPPNAGTFRSTVFQELSAASSRLGRVGQGVLTGPVGYSLGMELDIVVILGLAEGAFPNQPLDDPLVPDRERQATGGGLALRPDRQAQQHLDLLATLASTETGVLVYARGDMGSGAERHPSRWWLDAADGLAGRQVAPGELESLAADWLEFVPSFTGGTVAAEFPATAQEFRLQEFERSGGGGVERLDHPLIGDDVVLARGSALSVARLSGRFTRFDGNLAGCRSFSPLGRALSATSLETWAKCPLRYFLRYVLNVEPQEPAEQLLEITPLEKGSLIHRVLELFLQEQLDSRAVPRPEEPWRPEQRTRLAEIAAEQCDELQARGLTGRPAFWFHDRRRILADLHQFLDDDDEVRAAELATPIAGEWSFGMPGDEAGPLAVPLAAGREALFRGRVDRIDRGKGGGLIVIDYKSGRLTPEHKCLPKTTGERFKDGTQIDLFQRGALLQLPVYGLASRDRFARGDAPVSVRYWFVSGADRSDARGYPLRAADQRRFGGVVGSIVGGIEGGVFCDRPDPGDSRYGARCDYCNADRLGTADRSREWEAKRDDPALRGYRDLAEYQHEAGTQQ